MRVLVVDHNVAERERLKGLLQKASGLYVVDEAENFSEAILKARFLKPDLILTEIRLPDVNGLELLKAVLPNLPEVKVVFVTIYEYEEYILQAIQHGARGYILKDTWFESLIFTLINKLNQDEFLISPRIAQTILLNYSWIRGVFDRQPEVELLTARERDVLRMLCLGFSNQDIAKSLVISENTVRVHLQSIYKKLNLKNRREAREKYYFPLSQNYSPSHPSGGPASKDRNREPDSNENSSTRKE